MALPRQLPLFAPVPCIPALGPPLTVEGGAVRIDPYFADPGSERLRARIDAPEALARALEDPRVTRVSIGGEPYRDPEQRVRIARRLLEALAACRRDGLEIALETGCELVRRDARLLGLIAERHHVSVALSGAARGAARALARAGVTTT